MTDLSSLTQEMTPDEEALEIEPPVILKPGELGGLQVQTVGEINHSFNMMIYGRSGVGKTLLAGSASIVPDMGPVLFIDMEGGTLTIKEKFPSVHVIRVKNWNDVNNVYSQLYDGNHPYKTIVIDSLTEVQKFSMYQIMKTLIKEDPDRDPDVPGMREWGKNLEQCRLFVRAFRDLPYNTIFTALDMQEKNPRTGATVTKPQLTGKLSNEVGGFLDMVFYYYIKIVDGETKRLLLTTGLEEQVAKDRSGRLPVVVEEPTMAKLFNLIQTGTGTETETGEDNES